MIAGVANLLWLGSCVPAWLQYRYALHRPQATQDEVLRELLADHGVSAYGRAYGFSDIRCYEAFRDRVPMVTYDDMRPWMDRIRRGEQDVCTLDPVTRLVPTSGSTGGRKLIPFTAGLQREFNAAIGPWMVELCVRHPSLMLGSAYWSISPAMTDYGSEPSAIPIGLDDDSAYLGGIRQHLVEAVFAVPSVLRLISDLDAFRYATLLCLLRKPHMRLVSVWHPSFFTLLLDALPEWWEMLVADVKSGGCRFPVAFPDAVKAALHSRPMEDRARELRGIGPLAPQRLWRHLRVVSCWGDAQAALGVPELQRRFPRALIQSKGLLATEAFLSIPFGKAHPVALTSHFFEFLDSAQRIFRVHELRMGQRYEVVVSTSGGLWRYRMGDLVEVDGWVASTPSLRFVGRGASVSDIAGEKLSETFVTAALKRACAARSVSPRFTMLAPVRLAKRGWCYTLFIEWESASSRAADALLASLEAILRENPHYALCRDLGQLGPLRALSVERGYETFSQMMVARGQTLGEIKPQALSARTDWEKAFQQAAPTALRGKRGKAAKSAKSGR